MNRLPGLNLCGAGRVVCLIDPVGDVYACPFAIHESFLAGNVRSPGGFATVWRESELFLELRKPQSGGACASCSAFDSCRGGCMAAKFFTGLPLDGPDPECVKGYGEIALSKIEPGRTSPKSSLDHSHSKALKNGPGHADPEPETTEPVLRREPRFRHAGRCDRAPEREPPYEQRMVRDRRRGATTREEATAEVRVRRLGRRIGKGSDAGGQPGGLR